MLLHVLDIIGAVFSFFSTVAYIRVSVIAWPLGIVSLLIDLYLYFTKGIYADMTLHFMYLLMTFYGWYEWKFGGDNKEELPIGSISKGMLFSLTLFGIVSASTLYFFLKDYAHSQIPLWDATSTVVSLIAQFLICRKIIECWFLWFFVDMVYSGMYIYKGIPAHGIVQFIYVGMAVVGYLNWQKQLQLIK
ncbi:MAG: nicotinamide mononucleotide transporter [Gammaproteobacteria bacterium]|nr:nicotinamide mononucleotide transporter [Gammaproteobacteria bacterium]